MDYEISHGKGGAGRCIILSGGDDRVRSPGGVAAGGLEPCGIARVAGDGDRFTRAAGLLRCLDGVGGYQKPAVSGAFRIPGSVRVLLLLYREPSFFGCQSRRRHTAFGRTRGHKGAGSSLFRNRVSRLFLPAVRSGRASDASFRADDLRAAAWLRVAVPGRADASLSGASEVSGEDRSRGEARAAAHVRASDISVSCGVLPEF